MPPLGFERLAQQKGPLHLQGPTPLDPGGGLQRLGEVVDDVARGIQGFIKLGQGQLGMVDVFRPAWWCVERGVMGCR